MKRILGTVKIPDRLTEEMSNDLKKLGVGEITESVVEYDDFIRTSRMDYDFVYREMITDKKPVVYLDFYFEDTDEGRDACYNVEFNLKQIPLNLRYEFK
ncbi:MAG: hypothetical protein LBQ95_06340 [Lachnospiraceae bacterium]|jgi:hypothetical protein|nr:hypothetical protein [Lachnospiraceae bacterium]